jgi:hypothetical protein
MFRSHRAACRNHGHEYPEEFDAIERLLDPRTETDTPAGSSADVDEVMPEYIPARDYARMVGRCERTIRRWKATGKVDYRKHGGEVLIATDSIPNTRRA